MMPAPAWPPAPCPGAGRRLWGAVHALHSRGSGHASGSGEQPDEGHDFVEVFAGAAAISRGFRSCGLRGATLDLRIDPAHNILTPQGFVVLLTQLLRLRPGGGSFGPPPPCSTWVFMSRGSTGRSVEVPEGNWRNPYILAQDALVDRLALALHVAHAVGAYWVVEQPMSSLMWEYPSMRAALDQCGAVRVQLDMGAYGAPSRKPTTLWGTGPYLAQLQRTCSSAELEALAAHGIQTTRASVAPDGTRRCSGTSELKGTQEYPPGFGDAHALAYVSMGTQARRSHAPEGARLDVQALQQLLPWDTRQLLREAWFLQDFCPAGQPWHSAPAREDLTRGRAGRRARPSPPRRSRSRSLGALE